MFFFVFFFAVGGETALEMVEDPEKEAELAEQLARQFSRSCWYKEYVDYLHSEE